ncbi:MAG: hypothetical protein DLM55_01650 [Acidimicrobiales bacterium]|nr:MAG: hypothetical protein DLM55_01650 [Acidimicrobiales bacterium]
MRLIRISRIHLVVGCAFAVVAALLLAVPPVSSAPSRPAAADPEGGSSALNKALETASRGYVEVKAQLQASQRKDQELNGRIAKLEEQAALSSRDLQRVAATAYIDGGDGLRLLSSVLQSATFTELLQRLSYVDHLSHRDTQQIKHAAYERRLLTDSREQLKEEIRKQQQHAKEMAQSKADAEKALARFGGSSTAGYDGGAASADPAPRNPDGTWSQESCAVKDPTTNGCLTPRTLHAFNEARAAGFSRYTRCYRVERSGEHGKGRACDFAAATGGFEGAASGGDKEYGNRLAGWFISNNERLGVLYVIWYRQIWLPSTGWRSYSGGGNPSAAHTNHVHLSVQ